VVARLESIDLNLLVALHALLEERHVTNAGARIHIGQSAMSGVLRRLRGYFGDELLVRVGNELQLTPFAESLLPVTRRAFAAASDLFSAGAEFDPRTSERTFTIAASDYALLWLAPPLLRRIEAEAPGIRISFGSLPTTFTRDPDAALLQYDILVLPLDYLPAYASSSLELFDDDFVIVMAADNPLAKRDALTVEDLMGTPQVLAVPGPRSQLRPLAGMDAHLNLADPEPHVSAGSYLAISHLLRASPYWALMPRRLAAATCRTDEFAIVEAPLETQRFTEHAYWHPSRGRDVGLTWLRKELAEVVAAVTW
jgi:DNA-binding transcriptional LysR family regulator